MKQPESEREDLYQLLSFRFGVRADSSRMRRHVARVMERFAVDEVPLANGRGQGPPPAEYHLFDAGVDDPTRYRVHYNGTWVRGTGGYSDCLNQFFWHVNEEAYKASDHFLLIHAGAVVSDEGRAVVLPADSGSGKTTLVTGLIRAGFGYLTDEAAVIDPDTLLVHPFPKALTIKESARDVWPDLAPRKKGSGNGYWQVDPETIRPDCLAEPARVGLIVFPRYVAGAATELTPLSPATGCALLGRNSFNLYRWRARALPVLARVASIAPAYRLISGNLDEAVDAVTRLAPNR